MCIVCCDCLYSPKYITMYVLAYMYICACVCKVRVSLNIPVCAPEVCPLVAGRSLGTITPTYIPRSQPLEKELKIQWLYCVTNTWSSFFFILHNIVYSLYYQETKLNTSFSLPNENLWRTWIEHLGCVQGEESITENSRNTTAFKVLI